MFQSDVIEEMADPEKDPNLLPATSAFINSAVFSAAAKDGSDESKKDLFDSSPGLSIVQKSVLISSLNPQGVYSDDDVRDQITTYMVKEGDNLTTIAKSFGVTVNTIFWANNIRDARLIKPGDTLVILPVSGVRYTVQKGDTLESIAKKFGGFADDIAQFNGFAIGETLAIGTEVIIPDGEIQEFSTPTAPRPSTAVSRFASLPEIKGYYLRPIIGGRNSRATRANPHGIHGFNGVDLANSCGMPVLASASGTVLLTRSSGWNGGYGRYAVIAHSNSTQTLYGHLLILSVVPGQSVAQGQQVGTVGSSGNSTGCHVHFEIRGAKNPF